MPTRLHAQSLAFRPMEVALTGVQRGDVAWGDYDADGDLDLILVEFPAASIYRNDDGDFSDSVLQLSAAAEGIVDGGDYDGDGDLDFIIGVGGVLRTRIYRNNRIPSSVSSANALR